MLGPTLLRRARRALKNTLKNALRSKSKTENVYLMREGLVVGSGGHSIQGNNKKTFCHCRPFAPTHIFSRVGKR
jgi:hypothetical protein